MSACAIAPPPGPPSESPAKLITDQTFGHYQEELEPALILVTLTKEQHAFLTELQPVPIEGTMPKNYAAFLDRLDAQYGLKRVANWPLPAIDIFCVIFEVQVPATRETTVAALNQEEGIETAQPVFSYTTQQQTYNDPYLSLQHGVFSIQAIQTHRWSKGKGVRIAVIDTGMDDQHPELQSSTEKVMNFVDRDHAVFRLDTHGTAVGGVIAANADNNTGMVGIAPDASLLALKACWHTAVGETKAVCNSMTLAKALNYSILQGVDIINLSLTGPPDPLLERLVLEALTRDIVVVGAKPAHEQQAFPVSIPGTIAVAMPGNTGYEVIAPGRKVLSIQPNEQYDFFDGSSFSTAHISGVAALIRSLSPETTPAELLTLLEATANASTGEVNACRAVDELRRRNGEVAEVTTCTPLTDS